MAAERAIVVVRMPRCRWLVLVMIGMSVMRIMVMPVLIMPAVAMRVLMNHDGVSMPHMHVAGLVVVVPQ